MFCLKLQKSKEHTPTARLWNESLLVYSFFTFITTALIAF